MSNAVLLDRSSPDAPAAPDPREDLVDLLALDRAGIAAVLGELGVPERQIRMRTRQLWHWIHVRGAAGFDEMTDVARALRERLAGRATIGAGEIASEQVSVDGTRKWLIRFPARGAGRPVEVETVYIPEEGRGTLCVSSQVGCTLNCSFCHTGTQALVRNLTAGEIVEQILVARRRLGDFAVPGERPADGRLPESGRMVSNVVLMGMGEPLYNFDNVKAAMATASDGEGISLSKRRITLSTAGVVPMIPRVGAEMGVMLAVSLHATDDATRDELVPLNRKYPIATLMDALRAYPGLSNARRITFEYAMLKGVNDSPGAARDLVRLLQGIPAKINLIPFNPWPGAAYACSDWKTIETFAEIVNRAGYASPIRTPRGQDILAACGQLKSQSEKIRASRRRAMAEGGAAEAALPG